MTSVDVFWGDEPEHQSEREFLARLRADLEDRQLDAVILANFYLGSGVSSGSTNVKIDHNTWQSPQTNTGIGIINYTQTGFVFTNNIVPYGKYGIYFDTHGDGLAHSAGWLPDGVVSHNVIWQASPEPFSNLNRV